MGVSRPSNSVVGIFAAALELNKEDQLTFTNLFLETTYQETTK